MAYYRQKDWDLLLKSVDDPEDMHKTWEEWHKAFLKAKKGMIKEGFKVNEIIVDINDLVNYCIERKIINDGKARSAFILKR